MDYISAKHILIRNKSTAWFGTDHTVNLYRGCCHGCLYCDSRSDCYHIPNFEQVSAKADALRILRDELARKVRPAFIGMGAMSDPYNPFERELLLTRHALELVDAYNCGVAVDTKSDLITRDTDLYQSIQTHSPVIGKLTITTVDAALAAKLEPRAPSPARRLKAVEALAKAGVFCGVLLMPVLPFLEDRPEQVLAVVDQAADAGARFIYPGFGVTMRQGQREHFLRELDQAFPGENLSQRYLARYGDRYRCPSPRAGSLWERFTQRCRERGILYQMPRIVSAATRNYSDRQLTFFN